MYSNIFITHHSPLKEIQVRYYTPDGEIDPKDYYKITKGLETRLMRKGFCSTSYGDKVIVVPTSRPLPPREKIGKYHFSLDYDSLALSSREHALIIGKLVSNLLKNRAYSLDYLGPEGQKFYKKEPFKKGFFTYHDAFFFDIEVFEDGRVGIWLDPTTRWKQKASDFVRWALRNGFDSGMIKDYLIGRKALCPSVETNRKYDAEIVDVCFKRVDEYEIKVNGMLTTVFKYWTRDSEKHAKWMRRNNISLQPSETPVITVQLKGSNVRPSFPPSLLDIVIELDDPVIPEEAQEEKKTLNPIQRVDATFKLFDELLKTPLTLGGINLSFRRELLDWTSNVGRAYGRAMPLSPPSLIFGDNNVCSPESPWKDPYIRGCLERYGPVTQKEEMPVAYVVPGELEESVQRFNDHINRTARRLHLAQLHIKHIATVERLHPDRYLRTCRRMGKHIKDGVVLVVLPRGMKNKSYKSAKRGLGSQFIKSQMIQYANFRAVAQWDGRYNYKKLAPILEVLSTQIYDKYLEPGESIWHLAKPAGGIDPEKNIYFMGFDVSRDPERRKEAAAYASICDSYGRILYRKAIDSHKGEKIQAKVLSDWFFDVASSTFDATGEEKKLDELILFKDGLIPGSQIVDYREGSLDAKKRLVDEGIIHKNGNIRIISVIKQGPHRIYGKKRYGYKTQNTAIIRNDREALAATASTFQGTPATLRFKIMYQITENMNVEDILRIFNDLRYLDWSSIYKQPKTILPLHIVQNLAKLSKDDILIPYIPR
jgi:hypothetical protein